MANVSENISKGNEDIRDDEERYERDDHRNGKGSKNKKGKKKRSKSYKPRGKYNNDPNWYFTDKVLADQASSISFSEFIGNHNMFSDYDPSFWRPGTGIPSVVSINLNPCPGWTGTTNLGHAGINIAGMKLYTALSSMNAKTTQYAPQDVSLLMLYLGNIIENIEWGRRALGLAFTYNIRNWDYPREIVRAMGFEPNDLYQDLAQARLKFNAILNMVNQISFPANVAWFAKCAAIYSKVYLDDESPMSQSYVFRPASYWILEDATSSQGSKLKTHNTSGVLSWSAYLTIIENQITALLNAGHFQYIYADVLRVYGAEKCFKIPLCDEMYQVIPEYDPLMLTQINNLTIIPQPKNTVTGSWTPSNDVESVVASNALKYAPQFNVEATQAIVNGVNASKILNFPRSKGNPDVVQRIEASRLTSILNTTYVTGSPASVTTNSAALADHYCSSLRIHKAAGTSLEINNSTISGMSIMNYTLGDITKFQNFPLLYFVDDTGTTSTNKVDGVYGDVDYFTMINFGYLKLVNDLATVALFEVR